MRLDRKAASRLSWWVFRRAPVAVSAVMIGFLVSCASTQNPPGTVATHFFQNPDRVWDGIEVTLDTLGYEIESSNRADGVIRAAPTAASATPGTALEINQVMNTDDEVRVYVKPVPVDPGAGENPEELSRAATDFISVLRRKLGR